MTDWGKSRKPGLRPPPIEETPTVLGTTLGALYADGQAFDPAGYHYAWWAEMPSGVPRWKAIVDGIRARAAEVHSRKHNYKLTLADAQLHAVSRLGPELVTHVDDRSMSLSTRNGRQWITFERANEAPGTGVRPELYRLAAVPDEPEAEPFSEPTGRMCTLEECDSSGWDCTTCGKHVCQPHDWMPWDGAPEVRPCSGGREPHPEEARRVESGREWIALAGELKEKGQPEGSINAMSLDDLRGRLSELTALEEETSEQADKRLPGPDLQAANGGVTDEEEETERAGPGKAHADASSTSTAVADGPGEEDVRSGSSVDTSPGDPSPPVQAERSGEIQCAGCGLGFRKGATIESQDGKRRCGPCHRTDALAAPEAPPIVDPTCRVTDERGSTDVAGCRGDSDEAAPRLKVECPACRRNVTTATRPESTTCPDCQCPTLLIGSVEGPAPVFDWARFLARNGKETHSHKPLLCRICRTLMPKDARVWMHPVNFLSVAHAGCVQQELGYAMVMLRDGEIRETDPPPAESPSCCLCMTLLPHLLRVYRHAGHAACITCVDGHQPLSDDDTRDPCEWNPADDREARTGDPFHARAEVLVGARKPIRLCLSCRKRKPHSKKRKALALERQSVTA